MATRKIFGLLFLIPFLYSGCISLNSHHSGRTLGKGNYSALGSIDFGILRSVWNEPESSFFLEIGSYKGITDNIDLGIKVNSILHMTGSGKMQILGNKTSLFASSLGLEIGGGSVGLFGFALDPLIDSENHLYGKGFSYSSSFVSYSSLHIHKYLTLTISPRYIYFGYTDFMKPVRRNIYGYSAGMRIGKKHMLSVETSQFAYDRNFTFDQKAFYSIGYVFKINMQE